MRHCIIFLLVLQKVHTCDKFKPHPDAAVYHQVGDLPAVRGSRSDQQIKLKPFYTARRWRTAAAEAGCRQRGHTGAAYLELTYSLDPPNDNSTPQDIFLDGFCVTPRDDAIRKDFFNNFCSCSEAQAFEFHLTEGRVCSVVVYMYASSDGYFPVKYNCEEVSKAELCKRICPNK